MTEYQPYGVRHFLRSMDAEGAAELRAARAAADGSEAEKGGFADLDEFQLDQLLAYKSLVLLRTPVASRPPCDYALVWSGRFYDVWQRPASAAQILEHLPLGSGTRPAVPPCSEVHRPRTARCRTRRRLATVVRPRAAVIDLDHVSYPTRWRRTATTCSRLPVQPRHGDAVVKLPTAGATASTSAARSVASSTSRSTAVTSDIPPAAQPPGRVHPARLAVPEARHPRVTLTTATPTSGREAAASPFALGPFVVAQGHPGAAGHLRRPGEGGLALRQEPRLDRGVPRLRSRTDPA